MNNITVELFSDEGNNAVLRLPERQFPGVLIQGDTLYGYIGSLSGALSELERSDLRGAEEALRALVCELRETQAKYEAALRIHGLEMPY